MDSSIFCNNFFGSIDGCVRAIAKSDFDKCISLLIECKASDGKVIVVGNGGSAGIASHVAVDFTKAAGVRSTCFNEAGLITCYANDFGYERWVVEALRSYAGPNDLVILISSSGQSPNMLNAAAYCETNSLPLITLSGFSSKNELRKYGVVSLWADSQVYNVVEMTHKIWLLGLVDYLVSCADTE